MKNSKMFAVQIIVFALFITSCDKDNLCPNGSGSIITKTLSIPAFKGIDFAIAGKVNITQGSSQSVSVTGHTNIINKIDNDVSGDVWDIDFGRDCFDNYQLTINITVPDIEEIAISGAGNITVGSFENQGNLSLEISGSGEIITDSFSGCEDLSVDISGSGTLVGKSEFPDLKTMDIKINGSGDFRGFPVSTNDCDINFSGSGICEVYVRRRLDVNISGSGTIHYKGNPTITTKISGSGSLIDAN